MKPEFFIVGAQKCGTTSLYNYLAEHPCVLGAREKEVHYFSDKYANGDAWYRKQFPSLIRKIRQSMHCRGRVITGEATPYYIFHPHAPKRISRFLPESKIIMMLRNPVDRAFSHYRYHIKLGAETLTFKEAIDAEPQRLQGELERMMEDETYLSKNYKLYSYLKRGVYIEQVRRWFDLFPANNIIVLKSEDFFSNTESSFKDVLDFLELPKYTLDSYKTFNIGKEEEMDQEIRDRLVDYFRPYNKMLSEFLGKDFGWDK